MKNSIKSLFVVFISVLCFHSYNANAFRFDEGEMNHDDMFQTNSNGYCCEKRTCTYNAIPHPGGDGPGTITYTLGALNNSPGTLGDASAYSMKQKDKAPKLQRPADLGYKAETWNCVPKESDRTTPCPDDVPGSPPACPSGGS